MARNLSHATAFLLSALCTLPLFAQSSEFTDIAYVEGGHELQKLDIYQPGIEAESDPKHPVIFWIHGGGWVVGDKSDVALKPKALNERGFVFVSINYRLLPEVTMSELTSDVAKALSWVHQNIAAYGGDPNRIVAGGHSAGAQLAALLCTDDRYANEVKVPFKSLIGCFPVDGDTYDIPKIIMTAEMRAMIYGKSLPTFGHRQKFENDPAKHINFSAVTHIQKGKHIPPFLILYFSGNPETNAQARRLHDSLLNADLQSTLAGFRDTNHRQLNNNLGHPDDEATQKLFKFLDSITER